MDPASYRISEKAVERIAQVAVLSVPGTVAIDAKLAGLAGRSFPRVDAHIDRAASSVTLEVEIVTTYPAPVGAITDEVRQTVGTHVETLTGLAVTRINIAVADAESSEPGMRVTRQELTRHAVGITPSPIEVTRSVVSSPEVAEPVALAPVVASRDRYDNLTAVEVPPMPRIVHISAPPAIRAHSVDAPPVRPLTRVTAAEPAPVVMPARPAPQPLRAIDITPLASHRPVTVRTPVPRTPVEVPPPAPLRAITVNSPRFIEPVSLPARKPLDPIYAHQPKHIEVVRPTPQPLRAVGVVNPSEVLVPRAPAQRPLEPITVDPANAEDHVDNHDEEVR